MIVDPLSCFFLVPPRFRSSVVNCNEGLPAAGETIRCKNAALTKQFLMCSESDAKMIALNTASERLIRAVAMLITIRKHKRCV